MGHCNRGLAEREECYCCFAWCCSDELHTGESGVDCRADLRDVQERVHRHEGFLDGVGSRHSSQDDSEEGAVIH